MKSKNAFTLIEVMVVLSILAIIAILAYNFFGSTIKDARLSQAATKIKNDIFVISSGLEKYYMDGGVEADVENYDGSDTPKAAVELVGRNILRTYPKPDTAAIDPTYVGRCASAKNHQYVSSRPADYTGDGLNDLRLVLDGIPLDVCLKFNKLFLGYTGAPRDRIDDLNVDRPQLECISWNCSGGGLGYAVLSIESRTDFE